MEPSTILDLFWYIMYAMIALGTTIGAFLIILADTTGGSLPTLLIRFMGAALVGLAWPAVLGCYMIVYVWNEVTT